MNMRMQGLVLALILGFVLPASARDRVTIQVGYSAGGGHDAVARIVAEHLPRHLPGAPEVIVENVSGAGSLVLARMLMSDANARGTHIGVVGSALALAPVFDPDSRIFDPFAVHYLATLGNGASYCIAGRQSGIETLEQLLASPDARVGATGRQSSTYTYAAAVRAALGGQFQVVLGFPGSADIDLAIERGDIQARCSVSLDQLQDSGMLERVNVIAELAVEPRGEIEVPTFALDLAPDEVTRAALALVFYSNSIHYPFLVAPSTPPEHVARLRAGFEAMLADADFLSVSERRSVPFYPRSGPEVQDRIAGALSAPEEVRARARALVQ